MLLMVLLRRLLMLMLMLLFICYFLRLASLCEQKKRLNEKTVQ